MQLLGSFVAFGAVDSLKNQKSSPAHVVKAKVKLADQLQLPAIIDYQFDEIAPTDSKALKTDQIIKKDYRISVLIENPKELLLQRPTDNTPLILYANGFPLAGMKTDYFTAISKNSLLDTAKNWPKTLWIPFIFSRDSTTMHAWYSLFHLAKWNNHKITVVLTLGWAGMFPLEASRNQDKSKVTVVFYSPPVLWTIFCFYVVFLISFVILATRTGLIRDPDVIKDQNVIEPGPYSLSQTQLAFWTVIAIGGFVYIVLLTGLTDSLNSSILLLIGISSGTTGSAVFIDYYKKIRSDDPANPTMIVKKHRNFLIDILSDGVNVSMQRTQTVLWNVVLGVYFVWYVITNKSMPEFNSTLLVLTGVSSALYVASKGAENLPPVKQ